jgi:hypothetical protein
MNMELRRSKCDERPFPPLHIHSNLYNIVINHESWLIQYLSQNKQYSSTLTNLNWWISDFYDTTEYRVVITT